jgi:hypothetical protein
MTKTVLLPLSLVFLLAAATSSTAQTSAVDDANRQAVLRQANRIVLDQKLVNAQKVPSRPDHRGRQSVPGIR